MGAFLGMRGTGNWETNERPQDWLQGILYEYPNGDTPLIGIESMMAKRPLTDPHFHWWTKTLPTQSGDVSNVYIDVGLATPYVRVTHYAVYGVSGGVLYVKVAEATADHFRIGHQALLRDASQYDVDVLAKVVGVQKAGDNSYLVCKLLENDDNAAVAATYNLSSVDTILVAGTMQAEGSAMPDAVAYNPVEYENYSQIHETPLSITRTAQLTELRTEEAYNEAKREAAELHAIQLEKSRIWGRPYSGIGINGKKERASMGWIHFIKTYAPGNVNCYKTNADYTGKTWLQGGEDWLNYYLEQIFRYGARDKLALCGSGALLGIDRLAKATGQITLTDSTKSYGIDVGTWVLPFGKVHFKTHPLFSYEDTNRYSMLIIEPKHSARRIITDTTFKPDNNFQGGAGSVDGKEESYITEDGNEFHFPNRHGYLNGVGENNAV